MNLTKKVLLVIAGIFSLWFFIFALVSNKCYSATTTDKISYGTSTAFNCTLAGLSSSATVGRSSAAVNNTVTLADDYLVTLQVRTAGGTIGSDKAVYVYVAGSEDGTTWEQEEGVAPSSDAAYTINNPTNFKGPLVIPVATVNQTYTRVFNIAPFFGGITPRLWSIIVVNFSGVSLNATEGTMQKTYTPITYTNQ